jgi:uncharacterized membrane protein
MGSWRAAARQTWLELRGGPRSLLVAWVLLQLSMPFTRLAFGDAALYTNIALSVLLQAATSLAILARAWQRRRVALAVVTVAVLAWGLEAVGSATGFPFGSYHYTGRLQPQLAHVPVLIPLAWLMMLPPAWAVASALCRRCRAIRFALVAAVAFTAWDLFLDPQMVEWNLWVWDEPGAYFGIPLQNYLGWLVGSALITAGVRPAPLRSQGLVLIYGLTWLLETVGLAIFWGLPGPALCGFVAMGVFVLLAWRSEGGGLG